MLAMANPMKPYQNTQFRVSSILVVMILVLTGCHSGGFKKPDFGRLAFWKKDDLRLASRGEALPPPSTHFDPEPTNTGPVSRNKSDLDSKTRQDIQEKVDRILANARNSNAGNIDPIRKPYGTDSDAKTEKKDRFAFNTKDNSTEISAEARNDIQAKLDALKASAKKRAEQSNEFAADAAGSLGETKPIAGWKNDFQLPANLNAAVQDQPKSETESTQNSLDARQAADSTATAFGGATAEVYQSANQAAGDMASSAENQINRFAQSATNSIESARQNLKNAADNSFQPARVQNSFARATQPGSKATQNILEPLNSAAQSASETLNQAGSAAQSSAAIVTDGFQQRVAHARNALSSVAADETQNVPSSSQNIGTTAKIHYASTPQSNSNAPVPPRYPSTPYGELQPRIGSSDLPMNGRADLIKANSNTTIDAQVKQTGGSSDIPAELLQGSSTFAPGSVKQLQPIDDNWSSSSGDPGN